MNVNCLSQDLLWHTWVDDAVLDNFEDAFYAHQIFMVRKRDSYAILADFFLIRLFKKKYDFDYVLRL